MKKPHRMTCRRFAAWLDAGMPESAAAEALDHAAACSECAALHAAANEMETALEVAPPAAPPGFTATVMERVAAGRPQPEPLETNPLPGWVRMLAEPAPAAGLAAGAVLVWALSRFPEFVRVVASSRDALVAIGGANAPRLLDGHLWSAIVVSLAPTLFLVSLELYRGLVRRVHADTPGRVWR